MADTSLLVAKITLVMSEITFNVAVITSSVAKITFVVAEITFKVDMITSAVVQITFVVAEITLKIVVIISSSFYNGCDHFLGGHDNLCSG